MKKLLITYTLILVIMLPALGAETMPQSSKLGVLKSAVLPGWGEHSYNEKKRGYIFNGVETALWVFAGLAYQNARAHENDLYYFATEYGNIQDPQLKSDVFLDRVSKYDTMEEYNEQMLRNRRWDLVYSAENGQDWSWESSDKRVEYFNIKTERYNWRQRLTYTFGAIALNHLVSAMDALYLQRLQTSLQVQPELGTKSAGIRLSLSF